MPQIIVSFYDGFIMVVNEESRNGILRVLERSIKVEEIIICKLGLKFGDN